MHSPTQHIACKPISVATILHTCIYQLNECLCQFYLVLIETTLFRNSATSFRCLLIVEIATLTHKFTSVTLYKNKTVRYAARMHAIIACQMEFQLYPMDIQVCPIYIESCK